MSWNIVEIFEINQNPSLKENAIEIVKASNESILPQTQFAVPDKNGKYKRLTEDDYNYKFFKSAENVYYLKDGSILI